MSTATQHAMMPLRVGPVLGLFGALISLLSACQEREQPNEPPLVCAWDGGGRPVALTEIGCPADFAALAAVPLDTSLPGAFSAKVVIDRASLDLGTGCRPACQSPSICAARDSGAAACGDYALYFQDTEARALHHAFVAEFLNGSCLCAPACAGTCACDTNADCGASCPCDADCGCACATVERRCDLPRVGDIGTFNQVEYLLPSRRFLLGAVTHYATADIWALELAPVDTASVEMIDQMFRLVAAHTFFGDELRFLPTSSAQERLAESLPADISVVTAAEIYGAIDYQPLNLGESIGQVRILAARDLPYTYVSPREIVVLDTVPNDITPVAGVITGTFQTPLSHVNILSQSRNTPNMALVNANQHPRIRGLDGHWARLNVAANGWSLVQVSADEADAWWESRKPPIVEIPAMDLSIARLVDLEEADLSWVPQIGAKAAGLAELQRVEFAGAREAFDSGQNLGSLPRGWENLAGSWQITSRVDAPSGTGVLEQSDASAPASSSWAPRDWRNFECRAILLPLSAGQAGLAGLLQERGAHLRARVDATELVLETVAADGSVTVLDSVPVAGSPDPMPLRLRVHDREARFSAGGVTVRAVLAEHPPGLSCGVWAGASSTPAFDDFELRPLYNPRGFAIPFSFFRQFMEANGFGAALAGLLADADFTADGNVRRAELAELRGDMIAAPLDADLADALAAKLEADFPTTRMRFRSSTNAEDLGTYSGAGLYTSRSGQLGDPTRPVDLALKTVWASLFNHRAFEERDLTGIAHDEVGMAVLVHRSYPNELANGVAITANIFDSTTPAYYVNVQIGEVSVTNPQPGILPDQFLYYWAALTPATAYLSYSTIAGGEPIMSASEVAQLGRALWAVHEHFRAAFGGRELYAMDVELKLDSPDRALVLKQARPYSRRGR